MTLKWFPNFQFIFWTIHKFWIIKKASSRNFQKTLYSMKTLHCVTIETYPCLSNLEYIFLIILYNTFCYFINPVYINHIFELEKLIRLASVLFFSSMYKQKMQWNLSTDLKLTSKPIIMKQNNFSAFINLHCHIYVFNKWHMIA